MTFEQLLGIAKEALLSVESAPKRLPEPLIYVLETAQNHVYAITNDDYPSVLAEMLQANDTQVSILLAMWKTGGIDVPSYAFCKALLACNAGNAHTEVLVLTEGGYAVRAINTMM